MKIADPVGHDKATVTTKHYARRLPGREAEIAEALDVHLPGAGIRCLLARSRHKS
ncbi:hypothetical protein [Thalassiella azotivora]